MDRRTRELLTRRHVFSCLMVFAVLALTCTAGNPLAENGGEEIDGGSSARTSVPGIRAPGWEVLWAASSTPEAGLDFNAINGAGALLGFDGALLVAHSGVLDVYNTATGQIRRRVHPPAELLDMGQAGAVVMVQSGDSPSSLPRYSSRVLTAYDAYSGGLLWQQRGVTDAIMQPGETAHHIHESAVAMTTRGPVWLTTYTSYGMDWRTGRFTWTRENRRPDCHEDIHTYTAATRSHAVIMQACPEGDAVVEALDPETGRTAWWHNLGQLREVRIRATADLIAFSHADQGAPTVTVFDDSGERLADATIIDPEFSLDTGMDVVGHSGEDVYFSYGWTLYAFNTGRDAPSWQGSVPVAGGPGPWMLDDRAIISVSGTPNIRNVGELGRPTESTVTDLTGRQQTLPLPVRGSPVGVSGDILITVTEEPGSTRISALRLRNHTYSGPAALRGIPRSKWPDACALLPGDRLESLGGGHLPLPVRGSREVFGVTLPHETHCRFATESGEESTFFEIRVQWVAEHPDAARHIAAGDLPWNSPSVEMRVLGPGTYLIRPLEGEPETIVTSVIVTRGRHVIVVSGRDPDLVVETAGILPPIADAVQVSHHRPGSGTHHGVGRVMTTSHPGPEKGRTPEPHRPEWEG
ncbi:PQQ-binding-like beta-propeller repeat protein [Streptomyces sp. YIM 98790]|uniref:outer membrane protein assembly factor BamB family protein n=1 Tax=Streptomyces sp. YIM 98790 TaxID=2689077 RepID=UPI00140B17A0|nr:PQQ-binding-like beta-propeller repeat protein [Streptomyces sp. YIM 98790]